MAQHSVRIVVGTAGHIDHGKTALVKALTGIDADRLEEEKRRGITIDIGFAHLELPAPGGTAVRFGFVDVPGHERFVRNMLAGIGGIDLVLLIIAADEGIKPQTREHFEICKLLGISLGITVITKADRVSAEKLISTSAEVDEIVRGSFLDSSGSPIITVSAVTGHGLDELKREMVKAASSIPARYAEADLRLPIDRVFTMKGFGTVVTGTMAAGTVRVGDEIEIAPGGKTVRIRGVQVHNATVESARAGERAALNLAGVEKKELARGMTLVAPGLCRPTSEADAHIRMISVEKTPKYGQRYHFHCFTSETIATIRHFNASTGFASLRFAAPQFLLPGDRFILRQFSPVVTVGGGAVLDAAPLKASSESFLSVMLGGSPAEMLFARIDRRNTHGLSLVNAVAESGWTRSQVEEVAGQLAKSSRIVRAEDVFISAEHFDHAARLLLEALGRFHEADTLAAGVSREELRAGLHFSLTVFAAVVSQVVREKKIDELGEQLRLSGRSVVMKDDESLARQTIERAFSSAGLRVPAMNDVIGALPLDKARAQKIVTLLLRERILIRLADDLVFHASTLDSLCQTMRDYKTQSPTIDVARFKDLTAVSRKYAIPLLEFLDRERITCRQGDVRIIL